MKNNCLYDFFDFIGRIDNKFLLINQSDEVREPTECSGRMPKRNGSITCAEGDVSVCAGYGLCKEGPGNFPVSVLLDINRISNRCLFMRKLRNVKLRSNGRSVLI